MREILFRAKSKDNGEWTEGYYAILGDEDLARHFIVQNCAVLKLSENQEDNMCFNDVEIDPETLCQFTGMTDKNGDRIWENDIVYIRSSGLSGYGIIEYNGGCLIVRDKKRKRTYRLFGEWKIRVDGNKFDNPELLQ